MSNTVTRPSAGPSPHPDPTRGSGPQGDPSGKLRAYLSRVRRRASGLTLALASWDIALGVLFLVGVAVIATHMSLRGDQVRLLLAGLTLSWGALVGGWHARRWVQRLGSHRRVAQSIAQPSHFGLQASPQIGPQVGQELPKSAGPPSKPSATANPDSASPPPERPDSKGSASQDHRSPDSELGLRAEIFAAWQLHEDSRRPPSPKDANAPAKAAHSPELREHYIAQIEKRCRDFPPARAWPSPPIHGRLLLSALLLLGALIFSWIPALVDANPKLWQGIDDRKRPLPAPFWADVQVRVQSPAYTGQGPAFWDNPVGAQSVLAGSELEIRVGVLADTGIENMHLQNLSGSAQQSGYAMQKLAADTQAAAPSNSDLVYFTTRVMVEKAMQLHATGWPDDLPQRLGPHAPLLQLRLLADQRPSIRLIPPSAKKAHSEREQSITLVVEAQDDYGLGELEIVYQLPDGELHHLPLPLQGNPKRSHQRYAWDLSAIPLDQRAEVMYWARARDKDPRGSSRSSQPAQTPENSKAASARGAGDKTADPKKPSASPAEPTGQQQGRQQDRPGKIGESNKFLLQVDDHQAEHEQNIASLIQLRSQALDLLAQRLVPSIPEAVNRRELPLLHERIEIATTLHHAHDNWLAALSLAVDRLSVDALAGRASVRVLSEIYTRVQKLQRDEAQYLRALPPRWIIENESSSDAITRLRPNKRTDGSNPNAKAIPDKLVHAVLDELSDLNPKFIAQLEDEIIRLDDLVDEQVIEQIEQLLTRIQAAQTKLVELLEQLKAGDQSVRPKIDQLQRRIALDSRRLQRAREQLLKELGQEFINQDAFAALQAKMQHQGLKQRLAEGDIDGALEQAREGLKSSESLRESIAQRMQSAPQSKDRMSPEARQRMELLRQLSQLQDDQKGIQAETKPWLSQWKNWSRSQRPPDSQGYEAMRDAIDKLRQGLSKIHDASLGREARSRYEELRNEIEDFEAQFPPKAKEKPDASAPTKPATKADDAKDPERPTPQAPVFDAMQAYEKMEKIQRELSKTKAGAQHRNLKRLSTLLKQLQEQAEQTRVSLPQFAEAQFPQSREKVKTLRERQSGVESRIEKLPSLDIAQALNREGLGHLKEAQRAVKRGRQALSREQLLRAEHAQNEAIEAIQKVIDSQRQNPPPPPSSSGSPPSSTDAEQDRSLRQEVLDAMKERGQESLPPSTKSYYEELLQ